MTKTTVPGYFVASNGVKLVNPSFYARVEMTANGFEVFNRYDEQTSSWTKIPLMSEEQLVEKLCERLASWQIPSFCYRIAKTIQEWKEQDEIAASPGRGQRQMTGAYSGWSHPIVRSKLVEALAGEEEAMELLFKAGMRL